MPEVECPECETRLLNVQPSAGGMVRCLNCGSRFLVDEAAEKTPSGALSDSADLPSPAAPGELRVRATEAETSRKIPAAASYGLLRAFGFAVFISLIVLAFYIALEIWSLNTIFSKVLGVMAALAAFGIPGYFILRMMAVPTDVDALLLKLAERRGAAPELIPSAPGATLPYILPLTAVGGVLIIIPLMFFAGMEMSRGEPLLFFPVGVCVFLAGLGLGELKRFFWRMEYVGRVLIHKLEGKTFDTTQVEVQKGSRADLLLVATACCLVICFLMLATSQRSGMLILALPGLGCAGGCYSLYCCTHGFIRLVHTWEHAASLLLPASARPRMPMEASIWNEGLIWAAYCWAFGLFWSNDYRSGWEFFALLSGVLIAIWAAKMLTLFLRAMLAAECLAHAASGKEQTYYWVLHHFAFPDILRNWACTAPSIAALLLAGWAWMSLGGRGQGGREGLLVVFVPLYVALWVLVVAARSIRAADSLKIAYGKSESGKEHR